MKRATHVIFSLCIVTALGCKKKAAEPAAEPGTASGSAAAPTAPAPAPTPPPPPAEGSAPPAGSAEGSAAGSAAAGTGSDDGSVDTNDKAERFPDGRVCCVYSDVDHPGKRTYEVASVGACEKYMDSRYAPLKKCPAAK